MFGNGNNKTPQVPTGTMGRVGSHLQGILSRIDQLKPDSISMCGSNNVTKAVFRLISTDNIASFEDAGL